MLNNFSIEQSYIFIEYSFKESIYEFNPIFAQPIDIFC